MSEELSKAIARREPEADTTTALEAFGPPDQVRILQIIGLDPRDPRAHAVVAVAERYALDPVLGHLLILPKSNRPYITRDGYLHIAHRTGQLDGIEVIDGPRRDAEEREWVCKVAVYRKDMSRPFIFPGRAEIGRDNGPEMALARAERRALRRAFAITLPDAFAEDEYDSRPAPVMMPPVAPNGVPAVPEQPAAGPEPIGKTQLTAVQAGFTDIGVSDRTQRLALLSEWTGRKVTSAKNLTAEEASTVLDRLAERRGDQAEDAEVIEDPEPPNEPEGRAHEQDEATDRPATKEQRNKVLAALKQAGITGKDDVLNALSGWTGRDIAKTDQLTESEALSILNNAAALSTLTRPDDTDPEDY